ncbi:hypothetical protein PVAND_011742 [Polypedilum vanderplanki]|uniref:MYND-type domain-containing protein n=1 Tax=Polypedilum vanderplanki TaxID=319348 RepID=A0A9J6CKB1_POLVA|nr:hypothetical protein PVAND_011742 [Polypedilum vanderplanki]
MISNIISQEEIDLFVQSIRKYDIEDIGSKSWCEFHEILIKLSQQAIIEASEHREEIVKELLIIHDKLPDLIHGVYTIVVWRAKVLPKLLENSDLPASFFIYTILYHELIIISLLETVLYHENSCESLGELVLDLIDYCVNGITQLIGLIHSGVQNLIEKNIELSTIDELKIHQNEIIFNLAMKDITILSYLSDKISTLSVSASRRLTQTHDVPCLLAELLTLRPWLRKTKNFEKFIDGKWKIVEGDEILKVSKVEVQTWFCLRNILFHRETFQQYEINAFRQRELGKCSALLNDVILDQLPPLIELKQFLCTLQVSQDIANGLNNLILEVIPEIKDKIIEKAKRTGWKNIIEKHKKLFVDMKENEVVEIAKRLSDAYNFEFMADFEEQQQVKNKNQTENETIRCCSTCSKPAEKKCSRCEVAFYCCRECQVKDWILYDVDANTKTGYLVPEDNCGIEIDI